MKGFNITTDSIPRLIWQISVPSAMGFFFNTMFNVVDTYYTRYISTDALAGLTLSFPVFFILIAFSHGLGSGLQGLTAHALGRGKPEEAHDLAGGGILLALVFALGLFALGNLAAPGAFRLMGARGNAMDQGLLYVRVILLGLPFFFLNNAMNGILSASGDTRSFRNFLILGFFLNLALDPLFILVLPLGTAGIALATVLVQAVGTLYLGKKLLKTVALGQIIKTRRLHLIETWPALTAQSLPASLNMMNVALGIFIINRFVVAQGGDPAVAGYGAAMRIEQLFLLPTIGLNTALVTLTGQNYGAGLIHRVRKSYNLTRLYGLGIIVLGMGVLYFFRHFWVGLFSPSPKVIEAGAGYLAIEVLTLPSYVFLGSANSLLQGLKKPALIFWVGLYRQILMPLILFPLLSETLGWGLQGIWWGIFFVCWSGAAAMMGYARFRLCRDGCADPVDPVSAV